MPPDISLWTNRQEQRFRQLAEAEATGELLASEADELEMLSRSRARLHHPRTPEEIALELQQRQVTRALIKALGQYVRLHGRED